MGKLITGHFNFPSNENRKAPPERPARMPRQAHTVGEKYEATRDLDLAEIAKRIRKELAQAFGKGWKFTVKIQRSSTSESLDVHAITAPYVIVEPAEGRDVHMIQWQLNARGEAAEAKAKGIVDAYNFDNSDSQSDYFNVRFYGGVDFHDLAHKQWKELEAKRTKVNVTFVDAQGRTLRGKVIRQAGDRFLIEDDRWHEPRWVPIGNVGDVHGGKRRHAKPSRATRKAGRRATRTAAKRRQRSSGLAVLVADINRMVK